MIDTKQLEEIIRQEINNRLDKELQEVDLLSMMAQAFMNVSNEKVEVTVTSLLNNLIRDGRMDDMVSKQLKTGLQEQLDNMMRQKISGMLSNVNIGEEINLKLKETLDTRIRTFQLPNASIPLDSIDITHLTIPAGKITQGIYRNFASTGIEDVATKDVQLTVLDDEVVVENRLTSSEIISDRAEIKLIDVDELRIGRKITIGDPNFSQSIKNMIEDQIAKDRATNKIDIGGDAIHSNGNSILTADALGPSVVSSNLRKVGRLQDLSIVNNLSVGETLMATSGRVGINTEEPSGALTVWDEETEFTVRKHKSKTTYVGTTRDCDLVLGVNGNIVATLSKDGTLGTNRMEIGTIAISVSDSVPEREGTPGEIVIMTKATEDQPWAYQCLEGKQWTALKR